MRLLLRLPAVTAPRARSKSTSLSRSPCFHLDLYLDARILTSLCLPLPVLLLLLLLTFAETDLSLSLCSYVMKDGDIVFFKCGKRG